MFKIEIKETNKFLKKRNEKKFCFYFFGHTETTPSLFAVTDLK